MGVSAARLHALSWVLGVCVLGGGAAIGCDTRSNGGAQPTPSGTRVEALRALRDDEIVGALPTVPASGQVTGVVHYSNPPMYRALAFTATAHRRYRATASSTSGSHAAVWLAQRDGTTLDQGTDRAEATVDVDGTYYVVVRDVAFVTGDFVVSIEEVAATSAAVAAFASFVHGLIVHVTGWLPLPLHVTDVAVTPVRPIPESG